VFDAFIKVIPNFYSCKANVEFTIDQFTINHAHNKPHLAQKYARVFVTWTFSVSRSEEPTSKSGVQGNYESYFGE